MSQDIQDRIPQPAQNPSVPFVTLHADTWLDLIRAVESMATANVPGPVELKVIGSCRFVYERESSGFGYGGSLRVEMDPRLFTPQDARP